VGEAQIRAKPADEEAKGQYLVLEKAPRPFWRRWFK
jgi:hypothetical protein